MLLNNFVIGNFRAFGPDQSIDFGVPQSGRHGSGLTVFVGPNNSGKSTIVRAIRNLLSSDATFIAGRDDRRVGLAPTLKLRVDDGANQILVSVESRAGAAHLKKVGSYQGAAEKLRYIPSRRPWNDRFGINSGMNAKSYERNFYSNLQSNDFYVDSNFGAAIRQIDIDAEKRSEFSTLLRKIEPTITEWSVDNDGNQDFISFATVSGGSHRAGLLGDGVANLFRIIYSLYSLESGDVLLLDEPELSLHPQCQRNLHRLISEKSADNQIVLSTHSPYFISWKDIRSGCKVYRTRLHGNSGGEIRAISANTLSDVISIADEDIKNRKLYDVVAKEVFFSRGCLFVEGQEDAHLISQYIEDEELAPVEVFGYGSGGAENILIWLRLALDIGVRPAALFDGDEKGRAVFEKAQKEFGENEHVFLVCLPTADVRDKHKLEANSKKELADIEKDGIFTRDWKIKLQHKDWFEQCLSDIAAFLGESWFTPPSPSLSI